MMSSMEVIPARAVMYATSPSANVVPDATVIAPVDVLTAEITEPAALSCPVAETSYCQTESPTLKCLEIAAGTVNDVAEPAEAKYAEPASSSSLISLMWSN